jgi:hypothetical protein
MPVSDHVGYSSVFATLFNKELDVAVNRVVVEFNSPPATHIGKCGSTVAEMKNNQE